MVFNNSRQKKPFVGRTANVILTYQNGGPIFVQNARTGKRAFLGFGMCYHADIFGPVLRFAIETKKIVENHWSPYLYTYAPPLGVQLVEGSGDLSYYMSQKSKVLELFDEISAALCNKHEFDFTTYHEFWGQWDKYFEITIE